MLIIVVRPPLPKLVKGRCWCRFCVRPLERCADLLWYSDARQSWMIDCPCGTSNSFTGYDEVDRSITPYREPIDRRMPQL